MKAKSPKLVRCLGCSRQFFSIKKKSLEESIHNLNVMYYRLTVAEQKSIYGNVPFSLQEYTRCDKCGNPYDNFITIKKEPKAHKNDVGYILDAKS